MKSFDVLIIGAGVVGAAMAMDMSAFDLTVGVLEARAEFGEGASKGNSALMCSGWDTPRDTLERDMVVRGYQRYLSKALALGLPVLHTGSTMIAWQTEQVEMLEHEYQNACQDGFPVELWSKKVLYEREPNLAQGAKAALYVPDECVVDPFSTVLAYLLNAVAEGVSYFPRQRANSLEKKDGVWEIKTSDNNGYTAKLVINCAGLYGDAVDKAAGYYDFVIKPRKGQFLIFDKLAFGLVNSIITSVPSPLGRGVLIIPTIFGNLMVGPTAEEVEQPEERSLVKETMLKLFADGKKIIPDLSCIPLISSYAGMRPASDRSEYRFIPRLSDGWITVGGIRSTGLSAALGLSEMVTAIVVEKFKAKPKPEKSPLKVPDLSAGRIPPWLNFTAQTGNSVAPISPDDCEIVCHCEKITLGEINRALASPVPPLTLAGLRRRTRAGYGRCQGFFCGAKVEKIFSTKSKAQNTGQKEEN